MDTSLIETLQEPILGILGIGVGFMVLFIIYRAIQMRNKERLALIEKGIDPSSSEKKSNESQFEDKKNGLILIGIAVGVLTGYILNRAFDIPNFVAYSTMILLFCGIILLYLHHSNMNQQ